MHTDIDAEATGLPDLGKLVVHALEGEDVIARGRDVFRPKRQVDVSSELGANSGSRHGIEGLREGVGLVPPDAPGTLHVGSQREGVAKGIAERLAEFCGGTQGMGGGEGHFVASIVNRGAVVLPEVVGRKFCIRVAVGP